MILTEYNEALHLKDTYHCGYQDGESRGMKIGEDRLNHFYQYLSSQNRMEDLKRALAEEDFRRELMEEYFSK